MPYQVVVLEPGATSFSRGFRESLNHQVEDLGLDPSTTLVYFDASTASDLDPKYPVAGVYFGGARRTPEATRAVDRLLEVSAFVVPVTTDIKRFDEWIPEALHPVNGAQLDEQSPDFDPLAALVLRALRLIRSRRQIFISYMRRESRGVALQLYAALLDRGFEVFLDTHSIAAGMRFQQELWDRMNDSDLILLLDTTNARDSTWVADEIAQAKLMGLGIYQLIWPRVRRSRETYICEPHYLDDDALEPRDTTPPERRPSNASDVDVHSDAHGREPETLRLKQEALEAVLHRVERYRARSFSARRTRLIRAFQSHARRAGLTVHLTRPDRMALESAGGRTVQVLPVIGHLNSARIHSETRHAVDPDALCLLYDDQGLRPERKAHLDWLNGRLTEAVHSVSLKDAPSWIRNAL